MSGVYTITFRADIPDRIMVGDELVFSGVGTVRRLEADMIDITAYSDDQTQVSLGELQIDMFANRASVWR